ncbi:hypothetical protein [Rhodovulum sp.]|uniref:hypothetical protein n=1 Tax=Rhodovulum sp. TaxID=34009 RepID=UPI00257C24DB|nr:hypothetical protein [Rhodovulum sp.]
MQVENMLCQINADHHIFRHGCCPFLFVAQTATSLAHCDAVGSGRQPPHLTWWAGLLAVLTGIASLALFATGPFAELSRLVALLAGSGDASPAGLMFLGLGLIGLRDRIERGFRGDA